MLFFTKGDSQKSRTFPNKTKVVKRTFYSQYVFFISATTPEIRSHHDKHRNCIFCSKHDYHGKQRFMVFEKMVPRIPRLQQYQVRG